MSDAEGLGAFFPNHFLRLRKQCRLCQWIGHENPLL